MRMRWLDLAFIHWRVSIHALRKWVPENLEIQTFDGTAWIGVIPFRMERVRPHCLPPIPGASAFPELNVRTYVTTAGKPGVWFFSLDAASKLAVKAARKTYHLPYFFADMTIENTSQGIRYRSRRKDELSPPAEFLATYRPVGDIRRAVAGSLEHFLAERYCLYAANPAGQIFRGEILHNPWPLQPGEVEFELCTMLDPLGLDMPKEKPLVHFAKTLDVLAWRLTAA
jgi:uncharacterized protein YqjF (DUF2071 family)